MYDPSVGRWLEQDPAGFLAGDPNLYRYAGNSPTNHTDPSGLDWDWPGMERELRQQNPDVADWLNQEHGRILKWKPGILDSRDVKSNWAGPEDTAWPEIYVKNTLSDEEAAKLVIEQVTQKQPSNFVVHFNLFVQRRSAAKPKDPDSAYRDGYAYGKNRKQAQPDLPPFPVTPPDLTTDKQKEAYLQGLRDGWNGEVTVEEGLEQHKGAIPLSAAFDGSSYQNLKETVDALVEQIRKARLETPKDVQLQMMRLVMLRSTILGSDSTTRRTLERLRRMTPEEATKFVLQNGELVRRTDLADKFDKRKKQVLADLNGYRQKDEKLFQQLGLPDRSEWAIQESEALIQQRDALRQVEGNPLLSAVAVTDGGLLKPALQGTLQDIQKELDRRRKEAEDAVFRQQLEGVLQIVGGILEEVGAVALVLAPEPTGLTKAAAAPLAVHAADSVWTGIRSLKSGETQQTLHFQLGSGVTKMAGGSDEAAQWGGLGMDLYPTALSMGANAPSALRNVRQLLGRGGNITRAGQATLVFTDDPLVDANILIQASHGNPEATAFLNANRGLISAGRASQYEFLRKATQSDLTRLLRDFEIASYDSLNYRAIIAEARALRARVASAPGGRVLGLKDSRQLATAQLSGIPYVTNDLQAFKRAQDLGITAHYCDLYPGATGMSKAATRAAIYAPVPIR
jgi:predicted nucleic acid-binding protein